jgi:NAD(P)-dependent dehydrogenase (short-subunit alcohol dehydrogenase family)
VSYPRDTAAAERLVAELTAADRPARAFAASRESNEEIEHLAAAVAAEFGPRHRRELRRGREPRAAGNRVVDTSPAELMRPTTVNAFSPLWLAQLVDPAIRERGLGRIVMIFSTKTRAMGANGAPHNMAKAAMEALACTLQERCGVSWSSLWHQAS